MRIDRLELLNRPALETVVIEKKPYGKNDKNGK